MYPFHQEYFRTIIHRDIIERFYALHPQAVIDAAFRLLGSVISLYSINRITDYLIEELSALIAHIEKHQRLLDEVFMEITAAEKNDIPLLGNTPRSGILMAGLIENYYTCIETVFFRVSQFFENSISIDRRHVDLLEKMTLEIKSIRPG